MFEPFFEGGGTIDDLCWAGIADFGVSGLFAASMGSGVDLVEDEVVRELCAIVTELKAVIATSRQTDLCLIMGNLPFGRPVPPPLLEHVFGPGAV